MTERILHENIQFIEAMGDYAKIVTPERKYVVLMTMKKLEEVLPEKRFFRVHKSFIVNAKMVNQFSAREIIVAGMKIPLSRFKKQRFFSFMQSALGRINIQTHTYRTKMSDSLKTFERI